MTPEPGRDERPRLPDTIVTERLTLRPYALRDVDDVLAYAQDPEWARFLTDLPRPYRRTDAEQAVADHMETDRHVRPNWAIVLGDRVVGGVVLILDFENRSGELGYSVARDQWSRGVGTEAVRAVIDRAFDTHDDLIRIFARTDPANHASQRLLEKVGMTKEGVLRLSRVDGDEAFDEACFSILRSEWSPR